MTETGARVITAEPNVAVPILMYHEVAESSEIDALAGKMQRGYMLERATFARQMRWLADTGFQAVGLDEFLRPAGEDTRPRIVITFDDGYLGNYVHATPILREHGFGATFFVVSNKIGEPTMMNWPQLREMHALGMAIESHTANHPLLSTLDAGRTRAELLDSKRTIEDSIGAAVRFLSLPNGDSNSYYVDEARSAGYLGGCCSQFGYNDAATDRYYWRRIAVKFDMSDQTFGNVATQDIRTMRAFQRKEKLKRAIVKGLGKRGYDRLYNWAFGVEEQDLTKRT